MMYRLEDERLLTGRGRFTDNLDHPGALWAVFVRSPHAHAEIKAVHKAAAMAVPGARLVIDGEDAVKAGIKPIPVAQRLTDADGKPPRESPWRSLAADRVRHVGECVALCVADTEIAAQKMADAVTVDYEELPSVTDTRATREAGAPQLWPSAPGNIAFQWTLGDKAATAAAFAQAHHVVETEIKSQRLIIVPMETRAAIATYDAAEGTYHVHVGNQGITIVRDQVAHMLGVANEKVVVTSFDVGGGFGIRSNTYPEYPVLLYAAKQLGRPVRWTSSRAEAMMTDAQARDSIMHGRMALDGDGRILAMDIKAQPNLGAFVHPVGYFIANANFSRCLPGPYNIPAIHSEVTSVFTNTMPTAPYRGAGRPEAAYITECLVEEAAKKLGLDPVELRRRNLLPAITSPVKTAVGTIYDSGDFPRLLDSAISASDWNGIASRKGEAKARGKLRGIGLGIFVEISGGVTIERAKMQLRDDGCVHVRTTIGATGQGHQTVFAMLAAEQLGVPPAQVVVHHGDSRGFIDGNGASASRSTQMAGLAMRATAFSLLDKAKLKAAERLGANPADLKYEGGRFLQSGTNLAIGLDSIVPPGGAAIDAEERVESVPTWPNGCHVAEVEIDPDTGAVELVALHAVDDCGRVIAHEFAEGQVHGALAQGIGQAMFEHGYYDPESGQLIAGSLMDYTLPRAADLPRFNSILQPSPARSNVLGVKGVGESGTVGVLPAISNAVMDALAPLGVAARIEMPITPEKIWRAIRDAKPPRG